MAFMRSLIIILIASAVSIEGATTNPRVAIAVLNSQNATGTVTFTETDSGIHVQGTLTGLAEGLYGFHVHEIGDTTTCDTTGPHFDPHERLHGGRDHDVRHVGDFGNVEFGNDSVASVDFTDTHITLRGQNNILGRALVLHQQEDDLGLGNHTLSSITGNAGPRIACAVIGIRSGYWNSGVTAYSSSILVIFGIVFIYFK
ncbi:uncharacterized protein LOC112046218 [Bicyclus anynana]|uniref:Superoxide dismutase [Cu-Zn] n=1 Tax=Bicyclus anynana TaxID=110368 RepID=A0A6J1N059_BICAN|nr:uncharacterized protein LOC112046218 [Bicyclus anynana]